MTVTLTIGAGLTILVGLGASLMLSRTLRRHLAAMVHAVQELSFFKAPTPGVGHPLRRSHTLS